MGYAFSFVFALVAQLALTAAGAPNIDDVVRQAHGADAGRWTFDPSSYTPSLTSDDGAAVSIPAFRRADNECVDGKCYWTIGDTAFGRRN